MAKAESRLTDGEAKSPVDVWMHQRDRWPGFTDSKLFSEYLHRLTSGRDMHVIITAAAETGVGKTTLAFALAYLWDETPDGRPKGEAKVYRLRSNEHYGENYTTREETVAWPILDWHPEFRKLEDKKADRMEGSTDDKYVHRDKVEELKQNYWTKCFQKSRYHLVRGLSEYGLTQSAIEDVLKLAEDDSDGDFEAVAQSRISDLVNEDSFEEVYS